MNNLIRLYNPTAITSSGMDNQDCQSRQRRPGYQTGLLYRWILLVNLTTF